MARATATDGLKSDALKTALDKAKAGSPAQLDALLALHGGLPNKPNLRLAAAVGAELAGAPSRQAVPLLDHLGADDAAADAPRAFLPIAAAHGWAARARAGLDGDLPWTALAPLAADERAPVRLGARDALVALALEPGGADQLVRKASEWLAQDDRELRFGAAATVIEVFAEPRATSGIGNFEALLTYVSAVIADVADAPRSADRSDARRRALLSLPRTVTVIATSSRGGSRGQAWLEATCAEARHPQVREALERALGALRSRSVDTGGANVYLEPLVDALAKSAKPPRDPTRVRPGKGRGKSVHRRR